MPELIYLSESKLLRWPVRRSWLTASGKLNTGVVELGVEKSSAESGTAYANWKRAKTICREISSNASAFHHRPSADMTPGHWFQFECRMRWGKMGQGVHKGHFELIENIVFFGAEANEESNQPALLLGGWAGHLVEEQSRRDLVSSRIGSGLDTFVRLGTAMFRRRRRAK